MKELKNLFSVSMNFVQRDWRLAKSVKRQVNVYFEFGNLINFSVYKKMGKQHSSKCSFGKHECVAASY